MFTEILRSRQGMATVIALLMVCMLTLIGLAALSTSDDEVTIAGNELQEMRAFHAAEAGIEMAAATLQLQFETTGTYPAILPTGVHTMNDCEIHYVTRDGGPAEHEVINSGSLTGLHAVIKSFAINSVATSSVDNGRILMTMDFHNALVPIFQFAVFYDEDLEIAPGPPMTLAGRVHSNSDMWLQSGGGLRIDSWVTAGGSIFHGGKLGAATEADVQIRDAQSTYQSMLRDGYWLDHTHPEWYRLSVERWGGRVQDSDHGQEKLNVPLDGTADRHKLIEPEVGNPNSFESKATLKIVNGFAYEKSSGPWVDVTGDMVAKGILSYTADKFLDQREGKWVDVTEMDMAKLYLEGYGPPNGVIYFSDNISSSSEFPALRLVNGSKIDTGLTIASENPIYVEGDYNSTDKQPAALLADAITFLSGAWDDAKSTLSKADRPASSTTHNVAFITGNIETTSTQYSGGLENLIRYLEDWTSSDHDWNGSAVCLWQSTQAVGTWSGTYYSPPHRNWAFDNDLKDPNKLPPQTPAVRVFQRTGWSQQFVGFIDRHLPPDTTTSTL